MKFLFRCLANKHDIFYEADKLENVPSGPCPYCQSPVYCVKEIEE